MEDYKVLLVKEHVFAENEVNADTVRKEFSENKKLLINVMSSPGSGKTTTLVRLIEMLPQYRIGVMECDIDADCDAKTITEHGGKSIQLHTGGMCHMDAQMTKQGLDELGMDDIDVCFIENVGNLVCPAEFDTGADINLTILSVPEGDDKPAKYPLMYEVSDVVLINKIDTLPVFDFDTELVKERIRKLNPDAVIFFVSSKTGEGFKDCITWLSNAIEQRRREHA